MSMVVDSEAPVGSEAPRAIDPTELSELPGEAVDAGMSAQFAALNVAAWQFARYVLECSRAQAGTTERVMTRRRAGKVVAESLGWSQGYAASRIEFARQVLERLPRLGAEMATGRLEERKAAMITDLVADLDDAQAREVVEQVLDAAPTLPYTALRQRVARVAAAVDPDWWERRRAAAVARRRVTLRSAPSGAAELCGLDLPEDPAQDAHDRIVALAHAAHRRLAGAGIRVPVGELECEVMLTLTGPAGAGMYDLDVVEHVTALYGGPTCSDPDDPDGGPDDPDDRPDDRGSDGDGPGDRETETETETEEPVAGAEDLSDGDASGDGGGPGESDAQSGGRAATPVTAGGAESQAPVVAFRARTVLRLELRTVLGLDRRPGELPGQGPIANPEAVAMAWARRHCRWRVALYDDSGALEHVLSVRPPATGPPPVGGRRRSQVIEITAHTRDLDTLATAFGTDQLPFADLSPLGPIPEHLPTVPGDALGFLRRTARALARERARPDHEHPAVTRAEAGNRFPSLRLRDWVSARDRTCRAPGCTLDATACDTDHTLAVTDGGQTVADDLGALCQADHLFKHDDDAGWTVLQTAPGHFEWTSPTGRVHVREPEPYSPLPAPVTRTWIRHPDDDRRSRPTPPGTPRPNRHGLITDASRDTQSHLWRRARRRRDEEIDLDPPPF
ncbi:DUF222 domain-containing protein [Actinomycetospora sp. OC33-EN08]|uniref:DUF222 domain-containing protein n=1 Tax=Actinomycetospora aurantiaca TaxID=3129233 RepID=A0ABU8MP47_9PSEU